MVSWTEFENQYPELLPARNVLQLVPIVGELAGEVTGLLPGNSFTLEEEGTVPAAPSAPTAPGDSQN